MQRAHHDSFLLSPCSLKAVLHLWTAWYRWTVPECLLWVTKLSTASLLDFYSEQSSSHPAPFPRPTQHQSPTLSAKEQAPGKLSPLPPAYLGPLCHHHGLTTAPQICSPFLRWQKRGRRILFALNCCVVGVCKWCTDPSSPHLCYCSACITYQCVNWKHMPQ